MSYEEQPIGAFLDAVASERVVPAGGTSAAVVGAAGAALCEMVCIHTLAKSERSGERSALASAGEELAALRRQLLTLADRDADAVEALLSADDGERATAAKRATGVPLSTAEACLAVVESAAVVAAEGTPNAVPDAGTGVFLAHAALRASTFTVRCNLDAIDDPSVVDRMRRRATELEADADRAVDEAMAAVRDAS
jgi:formiminotetrahydrofolate cyclodeaminase